MASILSSAMLLRFSAGLNTEADAIEKQLIRCYLRATGLSIFQSVMIDLSRLLKWAI